MIVPLDDSCGVLVEAPESPLLSVVEVVNGTLSERSMRGVVVVDIGVRPQMMIYWHPP